MPGQVQGAGSGTGNLVPASPKFTTHERELLRIMVDVRPTAIKVFTMSHTGDEGAARDKGPAEEPQHTTTSPPPPHVDVDAIEPAPPIVEEAAPPPSQVDIDAIEPAPPIAEEAAKESIGQASGRTTSAANDPGPSSGERSSRPDVTRLSRPRAGILRPSPTTTDTTMADPMTADRSLNKSVGWAPGVINQPAPSSMIAEFASREEIERSNAQRPRGPPRAPQGHDIHVPRPSSAEIIRRCMAESRKASRQQVQEVSGPEVQDTSDTQVPESSITQTHEASPRPSPIRRFARWIKRQAQKKPACSWVRKVFRRRRE
jgi:hypothetical protein